MGAFVARRLVQAVFTVFGVMLLTFILFRLVAGDVSAQFVNPKLGREARVAWLHKNKLDLPTVVNVTRRVLLTDQTSGPRAFDVKDLGRSMAVSALLLQTADLPPAKQSKDRPVSAKPVISSNAVQLLDGTTSLRALSDKEPWAARPKAAPAIEPASSQPASSQPASSQPASSQPASSQPASSQPASSQPASSQPASSQPTSTTATEAKQTATSAPAAPPTAAGSSVRLIPAVKLRMRQALAFDIDLSWLSDIIDGAWPVPTIELSPRDGSIFRVDLSGLFEIDDGGNVVPRPEATCGALIELINSHPDNAGRVRAEVSLLTLRNTFNSQFFWHLRDSVTFKSKSFKTEERLVDIIRDKARYSLAITVPTMAVGWMIAMVVSSVVAYYRGRAIDVVGVFVCVLGMCVPYLVYMIAGQALVFRFAPTAAWGIANRANVYVPIAIAVAAGLGGSVRFYRTVILDEINRDYVRTARAKGVSLPGILFVHVLKNCMLPILTSLVVSIPFLIMGSLLLENFFGIPGLGGLMVNSVSDRDVPIISALTFLTAVVYVVCLLITDVLYAVFDPRIRLR